MEQDPRSQNGGWTFLQANLGRSRPATGELKNFTSGPYDIFLLQEPYTVNGNLAGLPLNWRVIHAENGKTAILVRNSALDVLELVKSSFITAAQVSDRNLSVTVISVYFPPSCDKELVARLSATISKLQSSCVIVGGDINMRHRLWGPEVRDHRSSNEGLPFVDFLLETRLNIWNDPASPPTFVQQGESWIDVTVASDVLDSAAHTWRVITGTLSDYNYITFDLGTVNVAEHVPKFRLNKFRLRKMATKITNIGSTLLEQLEKSGSPEELDRFVLALTATIQEVCTNHLKHVCKRPKTVPWWDTELEVLRKRTTALKRRFLNTLEPAEKLRRKIAYKICRAKFRWTLSNKRDKSWTKFCEEVSKINEFALPYKICANKIRRPLVLGSIQIDGRPSTTQRCHREDCASPVPR
ncbi:hypothetical protein AVEN_104957-1 [Araneus ventricosus]|uniref:Endonuclease/exonuclease/phosphatase domain-containing protein n=1 Tax=Araneus ventricosus TaxID=182803 RepID=A0A4Y2WH72_ARAVE|nr:hypothetical protein AVEN_104957-1 [Araneus ventricosus]